jgi:hypothetical protein
LNPIFPDCVLYNRELPSLPFLLMDAMCLSSVHFLGFFVSILTRIIADDYVSAGTGKTLDLK